MKLPTKSQYIAIKNWDYYQADNNGVVRNEPSPWIKDWTRKEDDYKYTQLTCFTRYILDAIRRLRGKMGEWPPFDVPYLCRVIAVLPPEKSHVRAALATLKNGGFITLVESATSPWPESKNEERREEKNEDIHVLSVQNLEEL